MKIICKQCGERFEASQDYSDEIGTRFCDDCWNENEAMRIEGENAIDEFSDADPGL